MLEKVLLVWKWTGISGSNPEQARLTLCWPDGHLIK
jgi:hypothetical protein